MLVANIEAQGLIFAENSLKLIGEGNEAKSKVFEIPSTEFCIKVSNYGKHVGKKQQKQFDLSLQCLAALGNKKIMVEREYFRLRCIPPIAVFVEKNYAYTLMVMHKNTFRLWDEEKSLFRDKDNWPTINKIKRIFRKFGSKDFVWSMDVNGNNILVDYENKILYLIDPYVPEE